MKSKRHLPAVLGIAIGSMAAAAWAMPDETVNYTYDARGRLVKVERFGTVNNGVVANYIYDKADNRERVKVTGAP